MSGQPYRYFTDPLKFRTEYMDTLGLRADLDQMNYEANLTYKQTGQLPAVSQMKDTRSTTEILLDYEKLKIDIIKTIATISNSQFGQLVVERILENPLNIDNKFLVFSSQRIVDIVSNIKKIYRYGIKGDENDAEAFVNFIAVMFNDKNQIVAQTKNFMDRQGIKSIQQSGSIFSALYEFLTKISAKMLNYQHEWGINSSERLFRGFTNTEDYRTFKELGHTIIFSLGEIVSILINIKKAIPQNQQEITAVENMLLIYGQGKDLSEPAHIGVVGDQYGNIRRGESRGHISSMNYNQLYSGNYEDDLEEFIYRYLDFINTALPSIPIVTTIEIQLSVFWKQLMNSADSITKATENIDRNSLSTVENNRAGVQSLFDDINQNARKIIDLLVNLFNVLVPNPEWTDYKIKELAEQKREHNITKTATTMTRNLRESGMDTDVPINEERFPQGSTFSDTNVTPSSASSISSSSSSSSSSSAEKSEDETILNGILGTINMIDDQIQKGGDVGVLQDQKEYQANALGNALRDYRGKYGTPFVPEDGWGNINLQELGIQGVGIIKRRGRPKGCGIAKPISYKESVKAHAVLDKGIMETPRFIKFGKYLVNNHKLHNEDIFALKRMAGGNIVDIPSIKISKNLGSVIKKMLGGAIPTYSDISKLSEPEKVYLHKVSQKSNILDKFDIPAPAKDKEDKDIHIFEVMRGEIMAGNDSKELISKFKTHILKLSRNGTLPKKEVEEILSELL
jgi:hypothetical protein